MATEIRMYHVAPRRRYYAPFPHFTPTEHLELARNEYAVLHVQVANDHRFAPDATTGTIPDAQTVSLSDQTGAPIFALKSEALAGSTGADFAYAATGYVSDSWHNLAKGRFSIGIAIPTSVTTGDYIAEIRTSTAAGVFSYYRNGSHPLAATLRQEIITGDEVTAPTGSTPGYSGPATIAEGATYEDVTIPDLTTDGLAQVTLANGTDFTQVSYTIPAAGTLRIHSSAAAPAGGWSVSYVVTQL